MEPLTLTDQERVELVARMVRDLCATHGLAGAVFLSAPTHAANALLFDSAPWLRLKIETDADGEFTGVRLRAKLDDYLAQGLAESDAKVAQQRDIQATISTLDFLGLQMGQLATVTLELLKMAHERFDATTTGERVGDAWGKKPS